MIEKFSPNSRVIIADILLLLTAIVWGSGFIVQKTGMNYVGPFIFSALRFLIGSLILLPFVIHTLKFKNNSIWNIKKQITACAITGFILFCGVSLQQNGLITTTAGKGGFLTSLYIILVPFLAIFLKEKPKPIHFLGAIIATAGVYLLTIKGSFIIEQGDLLVLICAAAFAIHILAIAHYIKFINPVFLASMQFLFCGIFSLITALAIEDLNFSSISEAWLQIIYGGIFPIAIGYTLQVIAQKYAPAPHAAIILGMESVFAVIFGWLILNETLTDKAVFGCILIFTAVIITQQFTKKTKNCNNEI